MASEPNELREYKYRVNNMETTGLLTPKMAERLGAVGINEDLPDNDNGGYTQNRTQAMLGTTDMASGVTGDATVKPWRDQQMGIDEKGRTPSAVVADDTADTDNGKQQTSDASAADSTGDADVSTKARAARNK